MTTRSSDRSTDPRRGSQDDMPLEPRGMVFLAGLTLAWERGWPLLWPPFALALGFIALALLNVPASLPAWAHVIVLLATAVGIGGFLWHGWRRFQWPSREEARRRLESDSGLNHRPLTALGDQQVSGITDPDSRRLWNEHLARIGRSLGNWRLQPPSPRLPARDPYALRAVLGLGLVIAIVVSGDSWRTHLDRNLWPAFAGGPEQQDVRLDVFVTPPDYTGMAPVYLRPAGQSEPAAPGAVAQTVGSIDPEASDSTVEIPEGSKLLARVSGSGPVPVLQIGSERQDFSSNGTDAFEMETEITSGSRLSISQDGDTLGVWPIRVIPDATPNIDFAEDPRGTERHALRLEYEASDDYGLDSIEAELRLELDAPSALDRDPMTLELPVPGRYPTSATASSFHDLTAHPWAGENVRVRLRATDNAGQEGLSGQRLVRLPERTFDHPIAQAIVDRRRNLIQDPSTYETVAEELQDISAEVDRYDHDIVVFLSLRTAARRLVMSQGSDGAVDAVETQLWDTALRLEEGDLSLAERALRQAQDALRDALNADADDEQIAELTERLREAMDRFLDALARDMADHFDPTRADGGYEMPLQGGDLMDRGELDEMLDQLRSLSESGARDEAQQMLSQLQDMFESLQSGEQAAEQSQAMEQLSRMMESMQSLIQDQQDLLDETYQQSDRPRDEGRRGMQGLTGEMMPFGGPRDDPSSAPGESDQPGEGTGEAPDMGAAAEQQEQIRRELGEMMRQMGDMLSEIPGALGEAEQAMRRSHEALDGNDATGAVQPQSEAVDGMQQGMQGFLDDLMDQMAEQGGSMMAPGMQPDSQGDGRDPLGRPRDGTGSATSDDVDIPDDQAVERAREILQELRRRVDDRSRPSVERDYLERLLERF